MKVVSLLTICLCTALWFTSCSDDNNDAPATPQFSIEEDDLRQDFEQGRPSGTSESKQIWKLRNGASNPTNPGVWFRRSVPRPVPWES